MEQFSHLSSGCVFGVPVMYVISTRAYIDRCTLYLYSHARISKLDGRNLCHGSCISLLSLNGAAGRVFPLGRKGHHKGKPTSMVYSLELPTIVFVVQIWNKKSDRSSPVFS